MKWALEGQGIVMRAEWDIAHHLKSGRLVQLLPNYDTPDADIFAVYPQRHQHSVRVRAFVDFLAAALVRPGRADPAASMPVRSAKAGSGGPAPARPARAAAP